MDQIAYFLSGQAFPVAAAAERELREAARYVSPALAPRVQFLVDNSLHRVLASLRSLGADALVIDARGEQGPVEHSPAVSMLQRLFPDHDIEGPVARTQTWLVVDPGPRGLELCFHAGQRRIAGSIATGADSASWREVWRLVEGTLRQCYGGKIAICLAGGGIEGGFYEMGVLRGLQYFLPDYPLQNVDIICGISVGSIIGALLANGLSLDEIVGGMKHGEGRLDKLGRFVAFDPNLGEFVRRVGRTTLALMRRRGHPAQTVLETIPSAAFAGDWLRNYLKRQLNKPGMTDDFRKLPHKFFVGATDQDSAEHVVFGSDGWDHIPIHKAVRASAALTPFYTPEIIEGRYYIDGAFTRTANLRIAVEHGATLIIVIDPLVPIASERPGYVASKGAVMATMQGLKSMIHGRFGRAAHMFRAMFPHVSIHAFHPETASMRVMAGSPMKFFYRLEIEDIAFTETVRAIRQRRFPSLQRAFARHGIAFVEPTRDIGNIKLDMIDEASEVVLG